MKGIILIVKTIIMGKKQLKSMKFLHQIFQYIFANLNKYFDYKCAFFLPLVLKTINENPETIDPNNPFITYIVSITTILVFIFFAIMNLFFYLLVLYLINNYEVETKFPRFIYFINLYKKSSKIIIVLEIAFIVISLLTLILINIVLIYKFKTFTP